LRVTMRDGKNVRRDAGFKTNKRSKRCRFQN
jgi:hypothetical protein